ncbi:MAG: hypothetical protein MZW92_08845 [Comamonadaceae bacterium]|nr:hypothetical protein [Comamonadaceae bacterium]
MSRAGDRLRPACPGRPRRASTRVARLRGVNDLFLSLGIESWKPVLGTLLLPPVPLLVLVLVGALLLRRSQSGWALLLSGVVGLWATCTPFVGNRLVAALTTPPAALSPADIRALRDAPDTAIVALARGCRRATAPPVASSARRPAGCRRTACRSPTVRRRPTAAVPNPTGCAAAAAHPPAPAPAAAPAAAAARRAPASTTRCRATGTGRSRREGRHPRRRPAGPAGARRPQPVASPAHQKNACSPVCARPRISAWTSCVPS